jgi:hypothetical protein
MINYKSISNKKGGVVSFVIEKDRIVLYFNSKDGTLKGFVYSDEISGKENVEILKKYALNSLQLNSFLSKNRIRCKAEKIEMILNQ